MAPTKKLDIELSVSGVVSEWIYDRITSGRLAANERLTEAQLVKELDVSRGAVREAMSKLAAEGLIEIERNKGAIVRAISRKDLSDFLQLRSLYESFACQRAAERINEVGSREMIHELLEQCDGLLGNPTSDDLIENDTNFQSVIMKLSGNGIMVSEWQRLRRSRYRVAYLRSLTRDEIVVSIQAHRDILLAILDGDGDKAASLSEAHVRLTNARIQRMTNAVFDSIFNSTKSVETPKP